MINQKGLRLKAISMAIAFTSLAVMPYKGTAQLNADFAYTPNLICSIPVVVNFQDKSVGDPVKWTWNFGDGNSSSAENPLKVYLNAGLYNVQLIIEDASQNKDTVTKSIQVNYLKADFSAIPNAMTCASNAIVTLNLVNASTANFVAQ